NAVLHWIAEQERVLAGVHRALKPGGRFVGEMGGHGNVAAITTALRAVGRRYGADVRTPWRFSTADEYAALLRGAGFTVESVALLPRPTPLPSRMEDWLRTFAGFALERLPAEVRDAACGEVAALLRPALCDAGGRWTADYVRLRFAARRG